ncbi:acyl-CoA dehydrogenase family protein [Thaumasiovibrio subtropicus]|uniref:acyl-CoA dehydrogenase family protein n=1 Tax=Thaumasiovibrio subtropicus TaxID=1891207 RepID=UPI000B357A5D|nr:acyl-CoA dehydrogenase family protein [Thaumasiovibrio subtropicus]
MDFSMNVEQQALVDAAQQFASKVLRPHAAEWDNLSLFPREAIAQAAELGFLGLYSPQACGGMALSRLDTCLLFEALSMGCTSTSAYLSIHNMVAWMVGAFGHSAELNQVAEKLCRGEYLGSYCLTEPNAGSDAAALQTSATVTDDGFVLNGAKAFISAAGDSDVLIVMARETNGAISAFVVMAEAEGISFGRKEPKMGWHCQATRTISFENVLVPKSNRLGTGGDGFSIAMQGLDGGRLNIAACSLGTAQQAINETRRYIAERHQFGQPLADFQGVQFRIADMVTETEASRQFLYHAAWTLDQAHAGKADAKLASYRCAMAKRKVTDVGFDVCNHAMQLFGGYGYINEYPIERYFRDTRVHQILEGANDIMRVIIARYVLSEQYQPLVLD